MGIDEENLLPDIIFIEVMLGVERLFVVVFLIT